MKSIVTTFIISALLGGYFAQGQGRSIRPSSVSLGISYGLSPPAISFPKITEEEFRELERKGMEERLNEFEAGNVYPYREKALPQGPDQAWQNYSGRSVNSTTLLKNYNGLISPYFPPDANGAVGPDHYVQTINCIMAVYNKTGAMIMGPVLVNYIFQGAIGSNCNSGDPIILYDEQADRWVLAEMSLCNENDVMLVAVSETNDPTGRWYRYSFETDDMPDYEKLGVWRDGYYMGTNTVYEDIYGDPHWEGDDIYVMQRSQMLQGLPAYIVAFDNPWRPVVNGLHCVPPTDNEGPFAPFGTPGLFVTFNDDAVGGGSDQLWIYELAIDWSNPYAATFSRTQQLNVIPFDSDFGETWENILQPGTSIKLHAVNFYIMNRPQYRNFGSYQTIVCCHTVDVDGTDHAGIRWYELRKISGDWYIRQQGTYAPDEHSRWLGSISLNGNNEIGLGYSISSSFLYPGIRYCGQSSSAYASASGVMDITESVILTGTYYQTHYRWGDYADLCLDPNNDEVFWFTTEYIGPQNSRRTRISSFYINTTGLHADFAVDNQYPMVYDTVIFTDLSLGSPTSYQWTISPSAAEFVNGTTLTSQNPQVSFSAPGYYTVKLKVTGTSGADSIVKANLIHICGENSLPLTEEFASGWLPDCWKIRDLQGTGINWEWNNPMGHVLNSTTGANGFAVCDPYYHWDVGKAALETPVLDLSGYLSVFLSFEHYVEIPEPDPDISAFVYYSINGGDTWVALAMWNTTTANPNYYNTDISFLAGFSAVKLRWVFSSTDWFYHQGFWALDDIWITGIPGEVPVAEFYADKTAPLEYEIVHFTDFSSNTPTSWSWSFYPSEYYFANGTSSSSQNPDVVFYEGGHYDASLVVSNYIGSDSVSKEDYLYVVTPGLWKGGISSDWYTPLNWDHSAVPDAGVTVTIPESAPNWPNFPGTYIVGFHSAHVVMNGGAFFNIEGGLFNSINRWVIIMDSALLRIGGGWYNYGNFYPGYGTVEFYGSDPSHLDGTEWDDMSVAQYTWTAFVPSYSGLTDASAGPSGDDAFLVAPIGFTFYYSGDAWESLSVCTNGWCSLDHSGGSSTVNESLFTGDLPNTTLAPWWDDLNADGLSAVRYKTEGTAPNRVFTVEWYRMLTYWTAATSRITFQLRLLEGTNVIEFCYGPYESGSYNINQGASVGIEDDTGGPFHFIEGTTGSLASVITGLQSHSDWPGFIGYRFTPPAVAEEFYNLRVAKALNMLQLERNVNVLNHVTVESRSDLRVVPSKVLHIGQ